MEFQFSADLKRPGRQLEVDVQRLSLCSGKQQDHGIALVVAHEKPGGRSATETANGAGSMHFARSRTHDAEEAFGIHQLPREGPFPQ